MLVWGSRGGVVDLPQQQSRHCPVCERERSFRLRLQYKVSHLWYVFKWVSHKQYAMVCEICQRGEALATHAVESRLGKPRIPHSSSRAWMVAVAGIACMIVFGLIGGLRDGERYQAYLASPQKGDLYLANLSSLLQRPQSIEMYGVLRVRHVDGDRVEFDTPSVVYDRMSRAQADIRNGKLTDATYFEGAPLSLARSAVAVLKKHGVVRMVERPMRVDAAAPGAEAAQH